MLEQWEADRLLRAGKLYSHGLVVDLSDGADNDYQVETVDGDEFFLLDVRGPGRNPRKVRFQLRYRRTIVLARMCVANPHSNPDGELIPAPHFHEYVEGFDDRVAQYVDSLTSNEEALLWFCDKIKLPAPTMRGGLR
ncbi:hypothetical protein BJF78_05995 [Pseudonocardia sp. CNS-139]|nr:hypothetical protein BJF78_05995 [Pseudonocardia sp. CNS-139]